jgi:Fic family protein
MQTSYLEIDDLTDELRDTLDEADAEVVEMFQRRFDYCWVHHEAALEGHVLTQEEIHGALTQSVITDLANVTLFKKIRAHFKALEIARQQADAKRPKLNVAFFQELYETLYLGMDRDKGKFRKDIPLHRTYYHDILPPDRIAEELDALVQDVARSEFRGLHPIKQAAVFGHRFMQVFPWSEASGMVGRLVSNIILMHARYFPVIIHAHDRERYYTVLKQQPNALRDLLVESMENSLGASLKLFRAVEQETRQPGRTG